MKNAPDRQAPPKAACALLLMSVSLILPTACAKAKPLKVSLIGTPELNGGYPCRIRIYQLKSDVSFAAAPMDTFWSGAPTTFDADLTVPRAEERMLEPGEALEIKMPIAKETQFIGAAADFRRPDGNAWKMIMPVSPSKSLLPGPLRKGREITLVIKAGGIEIKS